MRDLDIEEEKFIDPDFKDSIEGITSKKIVEKIEFENSLFNFRYMFEVKNRYVNKARFMMEGMGFPPKYWLCTGEKTLEGLMAFNIGNDNYNNLTDVSGRKDVFCLYGLPLFFALEPSFGDCLLLVSDIKSPVRFACFIPSEESNKISDVHSLHNKMYIKLTKDEEDRFKQEYQAKWHSPTGDAPSQNIIEDDIPF